LETAVLALKVVEGQRGVLYASLYGSAPRYLPTMICTTLNRTTVNGMIGYSKLLKSMQDTVVRWRDICEYDTRGIAQERLTMTRASEVE
jgi:hypothetical protein